jgi:hypothetical protein
MRQKKTILKGLVCVLFLIITGPISAQQLDFDVSFGFGAAKSGGHTQNKAELAFTVLSTFKIGVFGLDFSFGGTLNPNGNEKIFDPVQFNLDPSENGYTAISLLYRYPISHWFYLEPRLGYANIGRFIETDNGPTRVSKSNLSLGLGIGKKLSAITLAFRLQYLGLTANYRGIRRNTRIVQDETSYGAFIFRITYGFNLYRLFNNKG